MRLPLIALAGWALTLTGALLLVPGVAAQTRAGASGKPFTAPRTPEGKPDLQGNWSFATVTPFERPTELASKATLTDQEAAEFEKQAAVASAQDVGRKRGTAADLGRAYNDFWYDRGTRVVGTRQTSIVVDPPDGRLPALTSDGQARTDQRAADRKMRPADGPEDRSLGERCIIGFNAGPPFAPSAYNNNVQIVQTRDYVMVMTEMVHDARIVPLDGRPHVPSSVRQWLGDSRGRWDGDTLVIETTNFSPKNLYRGASQNVKLTERFSRTSNDILTYEFTIDDPATWTKPWTARVPMERLDEQLYEYACHEANYGMEGILKGTRADEKHAAEAKQ